MPGNPTNIFRLFEIQALKHMLGPELSEAWIDKLVNEAVFVSYNYSGVGYFLTVAHPVLPKERTVYSDPPVIGEAEGIQTGFLAFVQEGELMFECHSWGAIDVPENFREMQVKVSVAHDLVTVRVEGGSAA